MNVVPLLEISPHLRSNSGSHVSVSPQWVQNNIINHSFDLAGKPTPSHEELQPVLLSGTRPIMIPSDPNVICPQKQIDFFATIRDLDGTGESFEEKALLDTGATGSVIDDRVVDRLGLRRKPLPKPIPVRNADGSKNRIGPITITSWWN